MKELRIEKRNLAYLRTTRDCKLPTKAIAVYSYLVFKARYKHGATQEQIASFLGIDRGEGVPSSLGLLLKSGLVEKIGQLWFANPPCNESLYWFVWSQNPKAKSKPWNERLRFAIVYLPERDKLTLIEAVLYWLIRSLAIAKKSDRITGQYKTGLAILVHCSTATIRSALVTLESEKLIECHIVGKGKSQSLTVEVLPFAHEHYFRPKSERASLDSKNEETSIESGSENAIIENPVYNERQTNDSRPCEKTERLQTTVGRGGIVSTSYRRTDLPPGSQARFTTQCLRRFELGIEARQDLERIAGNFTSLKYPSYEWCSEWVFQSSSWNEFLKRYAKEWELTTKELDELMG